MNFRVHLSVERSVRRTAGVAVACGLLGALASVAGCAAASMERESVWICRAPSCGEADMVRSGRDEWVGDTKIHLVTVRGMLAVNFDLEAGRSVERAAITDCHGTAVAIPEEQLKGPGAHGVEDGAGWAVFVTPAEIQPLDQNCGLMILSLRERVDEKPDKHWDHSFSLSHHPKIGWVSEDEIGPHDDLLPTGP